MLKRLLFSLICCNLLMLRRGEYEAPKSVEYPFGDEVFNADMTEERVQEEYRQIDIDIIKNFEVFCPNTTDDEENGMYNEFPYNDNVCEKCDVRPTVNKTGVLVECYNCTDSEELMMTTSQDDFSPSHILFLTPYLEIANYSKPEEDI